MGGETTLLGFGQSRLIDDTALLINLEERIPALKQKVLDYVLDLEVAPFLDIERVMSGLSTRGFKNFQVKPGIGLRMLAQPHVVGRFDAAYGRDGVNFFVGLDYPFCKQGNSTKEDLAENRPRAVTLSCWDYFNSST